MYRPYPYPPECAVTISAKDEGDSTRPPNSAFSQRYRSPIVEYMEPAPNNPSMETYSAFIQPRGVLTYPLVRNGSTESRRLISVSRKPILCSTLSYMEPLKDLPDTFSPM